MSNDTRARMVAGAADLISRRGVRATTLRDVVQHTGTPRGSLAHHFPGGKRQMLEDALRYATDRVAEPLDDLMQREGAVAGLRAFIGWWQTLLTRSEHRSGCPVLAVAVEPWGGDGRSGTADEGDDGAEQTEAALRGLAQDAFARWQAIVQAQLMREGVPAARARTLALLTVVAVEGAVVVARANQSTQPLKEVSQELELAFTSALKT